MTSSKIEYKMIVGNNQIISFYVDQDSKRARLTVQPKGTVSYTVGNESIDRKCSFCLGRGS